MTKKLIDRFVDLGSDINWVDYGGQWCVRDKQIPSMFYIVNFENKEEWGDGAKGYYVSIKVVDLDTAKEGTITSALKSFGWGYKKTGSSIYEDTIVTDEKDFLIKDDVYMLVTALVSYGHYDIDFEDQIPENRSASKLRNSAFKRALNCAGYKT